VWRYASATVIGTSHTRLATPCQDSSICLVVRDGQGDAVLLAAVSDGAGSAACSDAGSAAACCSFAEHLAALLKLRAVADLSIGDFQVWVRRFQDFVEEHSATAELRPREFACTFLGAVIGSTHAAFFQVGDGAIVRSLSEPVGFDCVFWPQSGEYANTTNFLTDPDLEEADKINFGVIAERVDEVAIFTDGIQPMVLHYRNKTAHAPFFSGVLSSLRNLPPGLSPSVSRNLREYLGSPQVNERTDDDKTLVIASRRSAEAAAPGT
jgi:hypothetical protein